MASEAPIVVFAGPSLPPASRPADEIFAWRPPAVAGDAFRLGSRPPPIMVIIDGLFDEQPAIRHKELLEAIADGVVVIGGASMGALRAAELRSFGMIGVGRIFEAFAAGRLVGDDEVALLHGPEEWGWRALTEPMVNVRATLQRAVRNRVIDIALARRLRDRARRLFYKERTWPAILGPSILEGAGAETFADWLGSGGVDLKRCDALACLECARAMVGSRPDPRPRPPRTIFTERLIAGVAGGL